MRREDLKTTEIFQRKRFERELRIQVSVGLGKIERIGSELAVTTDANA